MAEKNRIGHVGYVQALRRRTTVLYAKQIGASAEYLDTACVTTLLLQHENIDWTGIIDISGPNE